MIFSVLILLYIYGGYLILLWILAVLIGAKSEKWSEKFDATPKLSIVIAVRNESNVIERRITNVLACAYPAQSVEVIVASDCSNDGTNEIVGGLEDPRISLVKCEKGAGKSDAQNEAIGHASGDLVVFTDADTRFTPGFLTAIAAPFADPCVGAVDGHLLLSNGRETGVAKGQGYYWSYEMKLRELESRLGILAVASGGCLAVRREILQPIPSDVGEDCVVPLDIVLQGYRIVHAPDAVAFDQMDAGVLEEFRARVRMTLRNWIGTWRRARLLNPLYYPACALALWSHKILRWTSPFFLIGVTIGAATLAPSSGFWGTATALIGAGYVAGAIGWIDERCDWRIPLVRTVFGFFLANAGFFVGVLTAIFSKKRVTTYR